MSFLVYLWRNPTKTRWNKKRIRWSKNILSGIVQFDSAIRSNFKFN